MIQIEQPFPTPFSDERTFKLSSGAGCIVITSKKDQIEIQTYNAVDINADDDGLGRARTWVRWLEQVVEATVLDNTINAKEPIISSSNPFGNKYLKIDRLEIEGADDRIALNGVLVIPRGKIGRALAIQLAEQFQGIVKELDRRAAAGQLPHVVEVQAPIRKANPLA